MNVQAILVGGPLDGRGTSVGANIAVLETPTGRYLRTAISPAVTVFTFEPVRAIPPKPDRWVPKKRPNPFPTARA